jgi:type II secretory pathway component PulM
LRHDVLRVVWRTENRQILRVNRCANSGEQIDTDFLPVGMDVLNHLQKMRERSRVPERATVLVAVAAPTRIEVNVTETMSFQAR